MTDQKKPISWAGAGGPPSPVKKMTVRSMGERQAAPDGPVKVTKKKITKKKQR